jgi:hypothetical protein
MTNMSLIIGRDVMVNDDVTSVTHCCSAHITTSDLGRAVMVLEDLEYLRMSHITITQSMINMSNYWSCCDGQ